MIVAIDNHIPLTKQRERFLGYLTTLTCWLRVSHHVDYTTWTSTRHLTILPARMRRACVGTLGLAKKSVRCFQHVTSAYHHPTIKMGICREKGERMVHGVAAGFGVWQNNKRSARKSSSHSNFVSSSFRFGIFKNELGGNPERLGEESPFETPVLTSWSKKN